MLDKIKNNYYLLMGISIFCLIVIVFTSSYAYFKTQVRGEGKGMNVIAGTIDLDITENSISTNNLLPISDSSKDTKAQIKDFTVKRTSNSDLDVCYNLYLVIDSISSNIKNSKYLKYELTDGSNVVSGNLSKLGYNSDGKGYILLAKNKYLSKSDTTGNTYKLKIWLSYDKSTNQNDLLNSNITTHIYASGNNGNTCPGSVDTVIPPTLYEQILADKSTVLTRTDFSTVLTNDNTKTLYTGTEEGTTVYYFAGNATDNWVKFGKNASNQDLYWRIIRTNSDGSVRLLYHGTSTTTTDAYIGTSAFNSSYDNIAYVSYMYGSLGSISSARENTNNSTIKTTIDNWYISNLEAKGYTKYLSTTAVYCNDRTYTLSGHFTYFGAYTRLITNKTPSYDCATIEDKFTVDSSTGNGKLTYPIALMTADEISYAGGLYRNNNANAWYFRNAKEGTLTTSSSSTDESYSSTSITGWWLLSPFFWDGGGAYVFHVHGSPFPGYLDNNGFVSNSSGVRPAVSLKSCVKTSGGDGSSRTPYTIKETTSGC